jgi:hypothetical protein
VKWGLLIGSSALLLAAFAGTSGGSSTPAPCRRIAVEWADTLTTHGRRVLDLRLRSLRICGSSWRAAVTITNVSGRTIRVAPAFYLQPRRPDRQSRSGYQVLPRADADWYSPRPPARFLPNGSWAGSFGGNGLVRGREVHLGFALFSNRALCPGCLGFGIESTWFPRTA